MQAQEHKIEFIRLSWGYCFRLSEVFEGKVHPENMLISDVRSNKTEKNTVDSFSISLLVLKIFAFIVKKNEIWRPPS